MCSIQAGIQTGQLGAAGNKAGQDEQAFTSHKRSCTEYTSLDYQYDRSYTKHNIINDLQEMLIFHHKLSYDGHVQAYTVLDSWSIWPSKVYAGIWRSCTVIYILFTRDILFCKEYITGYDCYMTAYDRAWDMGAYVRHMPVYDVMWPYMSGREDSRCHLKAVLVNT